MFKVHSYVRPNGDCPFDEYVDVVIRAGDKGGLARIQDMVERLAELGSHGLTQQRWADKLNDVGELRWGAHRVLYFWDSIDLTFVLLNWFRKKTPRTPAAEKHQAETLRAEYLARQKQRGGGS